MQSQRVSQINWSAQFPDLNPTENLWSRNNVIIAKENPLQTRENILKKLFQLGITFWPLKNLAAMCLACQDVAKQ